MPWTTFAPVGLCDHKVRYQGLTHLAIDAGRVAAGEGAGWVWLVAGRVDGVSWPRAFGC